MSHNVACKKPTNQIINFTKINKHKSHPNSGNTFTLLTKQYSVAQYKKKHIQHTI